MKKKIFLLIVLLVVLAGGAFAFRRLFPKPVTKVYETAVVKRADIKEVLVETGIIKPRVNAVIKVGARATGTILKMNVKVGDRVKKGQLIALIDDREILESIEQTEASLESARESLRQAELTYPLRIDEARASLDYARAVFERESGLFSRGFTTKDSLDRARKELEASDALHKRLIQEYETQLKILRATIRDKEALLKQLKTRLSYTRIYAPIDGLVSEVTARDGETIVAGLQVANLITIIDPTRLELWIYIDETDIGRARPGCQTEYYVDAFPDKIFYGKIESIYPQPVIKDNIVYYLATFGVPARDAEFLKPEMTAHVRIITGQKSGVLTVPNSAIKYEAGRQVVYKVIGKDTVQRVEVKTAMVGEDLTEIINGISESETVATKLLLPSAPNTQQR